MSMCISRWYAYTAKVSLEIGTLPLLPPMILFEFLNLGQYKVLLFVRFQLHVAAEVNVIKYKMLKAEITKLFVNDLSCDTL